MRWAAASLLLLAGCASDPVRLPVPCVSSMPERPSLADDAELRAMSDYQLPLALYRDRLAARAYIAELEAVTVGCSRIPMRLTGGQ